MSISVTIKQLQQEKEDFEWYPTSDDMLSVIGKDLAFIATRREFEPHCPVKLLDIGAGDGRVLSALSASIETHFDKRCRQFAIEKASTHVKSYFERDIALLGTEFREVSF